MLRKFFTALILISILGFFQNGWTEREKNNTDHVNKIDSKSQLGIKLNRSEWRGLLNWPEDDCNFSLQYIGENENEGVAVFELPKQRKLVEITCSFFAYQSTQYFYWIDENNNASALVFDQYESPDIGMLEHYQSVELLGSVTIETAEERL